jgi:Ca-activated chloride channel family protein
MEKHGLPPGLREALERCAAVLWIATVALLLVLTLRAQLARAADAPPLPADLGAGTLLFKSANGFDPAAPLSTDVRISVAGIVARVSVEQRFHNAGTGWAEAVYAFPLPDDAAVDRLTMRVGERVIEGEIRERQEAQRVYAAARDSGRRASLVQQSTPNLFTTAVANIGPDDSIVITIEYLQTARCDAGELSLRFPMTFTPRYGHGTAPEQATDPVVGALPGLPNAPFARADSERWAAAANFASVRVSLTPGLPLTEVGARGHELRVERDGGRYLLEADHLPMNRDFVLAWRPAVGAAPEAAAFTQTIDGTTYALLMVVPPADTQAYRRQPRDVIYVVDTSGSMGGPSMEQAKAALRDALGRLTSADRFNVIQFNSWTSSLYPAPKPFGAATYDEALRWVDSLHATGGTEMEPAIRAALAQPTEDGYLRQVIFLTDGGVANETGLIATNKHELGGARFFTIGIGPAPNSHFMRKAAQFGRGTYTHIGSTSEVAAAMTALFAKLERIALTDVLVDWPDAVELYPAQAPDLYAGEPLVVTASFPARGSAPLEVQAFGRIAGTQWSERVTGAPGSLPGVAALWARRKIEALIDSRVDGVDETLIRKLVLEVALEHGLVSPYTSLVAVDKTPARPGAADVQRQPIANMTPDGAQLGGFPQTATAAPLYRWLGALLLLVAAAVAAVRGERRLARLPPRPAKAAR